MIIENHIRLILRFFQPVQPIGKGALIEDDSLCFCLIKKFAAKRLHPPKPILKIGVQGDLLAIFCFNQQLV